MDVIRAFDAELANDYLKFEEELFKDGALSKKVKILMALALDAIKSAEGGVRTFTTQALEAGASWDEVKETLRVAYYIGQSGPLWTAIHGLAEIVPKK